MKKIFALLLLIISFDLQAQRQHINLDDNWKFHFGHAADPSKDFNYGITAIFAKSGKTDNTAMDTRFNDSSWRSLDLPHDWAVELPFANSKNFDVMAHGYKPVGGLYPETSIGWYRKQFTVNRSDSGQRFQVQFDGIFRDAEIWLNGFYLGNNKSGYIGESYDVTDYVSFSRPNVLVVRVDATQYEGWFYEGAGIYRHVWLNTFQNLHFAENSIIINSDIKFGTAAVSVKAWIENNSSSNTNCSVNSYITDRSGKKLAEARSKSWTISARSDQEVEQKMMIPQPKLWSLEDPYLYRVISLIMVNGKLVDSVNTRLGIRTIDIKPNGVFLNGKYLKIKGVNCHQDHAGLGSALPDEVQYFRIRKLKELGANAYRTSHNAPTPELLEACDSLGMLVMDEQRLLNSSPEYLNQFERLIKRDRNHPSVFMWSIGNEEGWIHTNSTGKRIAQTLLAKQKELDPSRVSTYAADVANVYKGVNEVVPVRGFNYRQFGVADYHHDHPDQPIIGTEMGSTVTTRGIYEKDSVRAYVPDQDITAPWWASTAETWWKLAAENDFWLGGFVWTGFDYRGEPTPYEWPNINSHFGIMDMCGFPKNIYYYYQSWWTDKDVIHISPHWTWPGKEGKLIDVWVNSNADEVELFLNGQSLGVKSNPANGHLVWQVNYKTGFLDAVGSKAGRKFKARVETTRAPYQITLKPYKTFLAANGKDASVINVGVIDEQGREVPEAGNLIKFVVNGDAKVIGVGNGDPSSHEPDKIFDGNWQRRLFNGKCQVILQGGRTVSEITFSAVGDGLMPATIKLMTLDKH